MIHSFSLSNYLSVRDETTLDLRIPGTAPDLSSFRRSRAKPDVRLPTVAVLLGPNGSGKTTILQGLVRTLQIAAAGMGDDVQINSVVPFLSGRRQYEPTRFRIEFEDDFLCPSQAPQLFRYELATRRRRANADRPTVEALLQQPASIEYEALFCYPKGRPRRLFERKSANEPIYVSREFGLRRKDERLKAVRENASVIATLNSLNVDLAMTIAARFRGYLHATNLDATGQLDITELLSMFELYPGLIDRVQEEVQRGDLGIQRISIENAAEPRTVWFSHRGLDGLIPLALESDGTQRFVHLLPQIGLARDETGLAVFDDFDSELHVDIVSEVLGWFRSREANPNDAQLFVSCHNVGVLDDLEKEEVFIVEKDRDGGTRIYGAQDVQGLRRDTRLYPKYRAGALGGVPKIG